MALPASAQIVAPDLFSNSLDTDAPDVGLRLMLLRPDNVNTKPSNITITSFDDHTLYTTRHNSVLDDIHDNGRTITLQTSLGKSSFSPRLVLSEQSFGNRIDINENRTSIQSYGHLENIEGRLLIPGRKNRPEYYVGFGSSHNGNKGTTNLYGEIFGIFDKPPPFDFNRTAEQFTVGTVASLNHRWQLEALLGHEHVSSGLTLQNPGVDTCIFLPMGEQGTDFLAAIRGHIRPRSSLILYSGKGNFHGNDDVQRETSRAIGEAKTTRNEQWIGVAWHQDAGSDKKWTAYYDNTKSNWDTRGLVPDLNDLGISIPLATNLNYHAGYSLEKQTLGLNWQKDYRADHQWRIGYQWLDAEIHAQANYTATLLFFAQGNSTSLEQTHYRAHRIDLNYAFPLFGKKNTFEVTQIIPNSSHSSSLEQSTNANRRKTFGGNTVIWSVIIPL